MGAIDKLRRHVLAAAMTAGLVASTAIAQVTGGSQNREAVPSQPTTAPTVDRRVATNKKHGFVLSYPNGWHAVETPDALSLLPEWGVEPDFDSTMSFEMIPPSQYKATADPTARIVAEELIAIFRANQQNAEAGDVVDTKLGGRTAARYSARATAAGDETRYYFWIAEKDGRFYLLSASTSPEKQGRFEPALRAIADSIRWEE